MHRPTSLVVVSILWLLVGAECVVAGVGGAVSAYAVPLELHAMGAPAELPERGSNILAAVMALSVAEGVAGIAAIACAIGLLLLRSWGRTGLEILTVGFAIALAVFLVCFVWTAQGRMEYLVGATFAFLAFGVPLWFVRKSLRSRPMYEALYRATLARANETLT